MQAEPLYASFKKNKYFFSGIATVAIILATHSQVKATTTSSSSGGFISPITIILLLIGIVVCFFYIKAMLTILNEAAISYSEVEEEATGVYYAAPVWGAAVAGIIAALVIWSYGMGPLFLYLGPLLCMISPIAILYCMFQDIKNFRAEHSQARIEGETEETFRAVSKLD